jgi:hypothetical protein
LTISITPDFYQDHVFDFGIEGVLFNKVKNVVIFEKADQLAKMGSHKKTTIQYHSSQSKPVSRQQLDLESKTNGIQIPRRKMGAPNQKKQ